MRETLVGLGKTSIFVNDCKLLHNVVVEAIEHNQKDTTARWEP